MNITEQLKKHCTGGQPEWREYVKTLKAGASDAAGVQKIAALMPKLGKLAGCVEKDLAILERIKQIRAQIQRGVKLDETIQRANVAVADHNKETQRILEERKRGLESLQGTYTSLLDDRKAAETAINELTELKLKHPELLSDEAPVTLKDLE